VLTLAWLSIGGLDLWASEPRETDTPPQTPSPASETSVDFTTEVFTVLRRACFECHDQNKQEGGLRMDNPQAILESSIIEPGDPTTSELMRRIELPRGHEEVMPALGDPLNDREVDAIGRWIQSGARWPETFVEPPHWSYIAPQRPELPVLSDTSWAASPIDHFVLDQHRTLGLAPAPPAPPTTLLRRVYLDLIGLPPHPSEVAAFTADPSPAAFANVVDDLLSRPQFGERWARPWLDLARYADSHGFQRDDLIEIWAYRDWVIQALNDDMPFDQFTIEQLAGDLLPEATESQRIATGFHRCAPTNVEAGSLPEETRIEQVLDRVNTTGAVWLGSTLECAQCHDHKYDPFSTKDYYRLLAFFNNTALEADRTDPKKPSSIAFRGPSMPLSNAQQDLQRERLQTRIAELQAQREERLKALGADLEAWASDQQVLAEQTPQLHPLQVDAFESKGTTDTFRIRDDGAVLLVGDDPPSIDLYTVTGTVAFPHEQTAPVSAIRLDVLTDDSLPGSGPGRGDPKRTNFVLHELTILMLDEDQRWQPLEVVSAEADFSQTRWEVTGAIDGDPKTGWAIAPQFGKPHWATFRLREPFTPSQNVRLKITLDQHFGDARTLGCFQLSAVTGDLSAETVPAKIAQLVQGDATLWTPADRRQLIEHRSLSDHRTQTLQKQISKAERERKTLAPDTTLIMVEQDQPRPSYVFTRGDYRTPGESVTAGTPAFLPDSSSENTSEQAANRLTLARWLIDPANPLVARVTVNRWWAELFGAGIVRTPEDFGLKGDPPTHPKLLDWLAVELMENGWSMKHILKTIVLSSTYQQSSVVTAPQRSLDPSNRWLARGPRFRMDAEMIRDNALSIAGLISLKPFGPSIRPYQPANVWTKVGGMNYEYKVSPHDEKYRRGIYVVLKRGAPYPSFVNFDANARLTCTVERSRSNTPLQALTLLNDPVYVEATKAMAVRATAAMQDRPLGDVIAEEFQRCTARQPSEAEQQTLRTLYEDQWQAAEKHPQAARSLTKDLKLPGESTPSELAAWYSVTTVLLNLHETITKE